MNVTSKPVTLKVILKLNHTKSITHTGMCAYAWACIIAVELVKGEYWTGGSMVCLKHDTFVLNFIYGHMLTGNGIEIKMYYKRS